MVHLSLVLIFGDSLIFKKAARKKGHKVACVLAEAMNLIFI
jgi:glutamate-1-semialdehyde aminotransferase